MSDGSRPLAVTNMDRVAFHMAEYSSMKTEIAELVKQTGTLFTFAITTWGAIVAWLLTSDLQPNAPAVARWLPLTLSALFGALAFSCVIRMKAKADYLGRMEQALAFEGLGWERDREGTPKLLIVAYTLSWGALNGLGVLFGVLYS